MFQTIPHPSKDGSGVPALLQHQRLEREGRQLQSGHRIPPNASSSFGSDRSTVMCSGAQSSFKNRRSGTSGPSATFILFAAFTVSVKAAEVNTVRALLSVCATLQQRRRARSLADGLHSNAQRALSRPWTCRDG